MVREGGMRTALAVLCVMAGAACSGDAEPAQSETTEDSAATAVPAPAPESPAPAATEGPRTRSAAEQPGVAYGTLGPEGTGEKVGVTLTDDDVRLSTDSIGGGTTTFVIENKGTKVHVVEVFSEHYGRWRSAPVPPGGSLTMRMPLTFATYEVFCPQGEGSHKADGMVATLRVQ